MFNPDNMVTKLDIVGGLSILANETPLFVEFQGATIVVVLPDLTTLLDLGTRFTSKQRRAWVHSLHPLLTKSGQQIRVLVRGRTLGVLSATSEPTFVARVFGLDPVELHFSAILKALLARNDRSPA